MGAHFLFVSGSMTAVLASNAARAANIAISIGGDDLILRGSAPPPAAVLNLLYHHKSAPIPANDTGKPTVCDDAGRRHDR